MTRFEACADIVFRWEGGFVNHPDDPGGATNMGITIRTLGKWRGEDVTPVDVQYLEKSEAQNIYREWYWKPSHAEEFRPGVDLVVFSGAIHAGPAKSIRILQAAIGAVVDGIVGPETRWKASQMDPVDIIAKYIDLRFAHLRSLKHWATFGRGWTNRLNDVQEEAIKMARADTGPVLIAGTEQDGRLLRAYRLARAEIGTAEVPGSLSNPEIDSWFARLGFSFKDDTAWCAAFQGAMLEAAGLDSTRALNARSYLEWGQPTNRPQEGDIVVFWRVSRSDWRGHVGFVVKVDWAARRVLVLGGNQSNQVNEQWYPMNGRSVGLLGFRTLKSTEEKTVSNLINQPTNTPNRKVVAGGMAALAAGIVAEPLFNYVPFLNNLVAAETPEEFVTAIFVAVVSFGTAYFTRERA